jgi:uncharacterized caspase-like protein
VALVVGNGARSALNPLKNPVNDATDTVVVAYRIDGIRPCTS